MKTPDLLDIVAECLDREPGSISIEDSPETVEEWDSVGHLSILAELEEAGVDPDDEDARIFTSMSELVEVLKDRGIISDQ